MVYPSKQKYDKENMVKVNVSFNRKTEPELVARIEAEPNKAGYIKDLIRADIESSKPEEK